MESRRFDDFARVLASGATRRSVVRAILGGTIAALAGVDVEAAGQTPRPLRAPRRCGRSVNVHCDGGCCARHDVCVSGQGCMPASGTPCGNGYCAAHLVCDNNSSCVHCTNAVDLCGGNCGPCPNGAACHVDADCASGQCVDLVCGGCQSNADCLSTAPVCDAGVCRVCHSDAECQLNGATTLSCHSDGTCDSFCTDGRQSGDETDVDCGGSCAPCGLGKRCGSDLDCVSGTTCNDIGRCATACATPGACQLGEACHTDADCLSGFCFTTVAVCGCQDDGDCPPSVPPSVCDPVSHLCFDQCQTGIKDGDETDVDCGGSCPPCQAGQGCVVDADCESGFCNLNTCGCNDDVDCPRGQTCQQGICINSCANGIKDGRETDVDCGGPECSPCKAGQGCAVDTDCASGSCGVTTPLICDCGVDADCPTGQTCNLGRCAAAASCTDNIRNGNETDVDCGGPDCPPCQLGQHCLSDGDCAGGRTVPVCDNGVCAECPSEKEFLACSGSCEPSGSICCGPDVIDPSSGATCCGGEVFVPSNGVICYHDEVCPVDQACGDACCNHSSDQFCCNGECVNGNEDPVANQFRTCPDGACCPFGFWCFPGDSGGFQCCPIAGGGDCQPA